MSILLLVLLIWSLPNQALVLALGWGILLVGQRIYPKGFLWLAFFPGLLHLKDALWTGWASSTAALLLLGLFLSTKNRPWSSLFLLPLALQGGLLGLFLLGGIHALARIESLKEEARARGAAFLPSPAGVLTPLLLGGLLSGLAFLPLPHPHLPLPTWTRAPLEAARKALEAPAEKVVYEAPKEGFPSWVLWLDRALEYALPLGLLLVLLVLLPLLGRGKKTPWGGFHLLPVVLSLSAFGLLLLYLGSLGGREGAGGAPLLPGPSPLSEGAGKGEAVPGPRGLGEVGVALAGLSALLTLALLLVLAVWIWRIWPRAKEGAPEETLPSAKRGGGGPLPLPQDRVRRAYALALQTLRKNGLPRLAPEGPLEYLERVRGLFPEGAPALEGLTRLYLPVRYGEGIRGEEAEAAEAFLEAILKVCSTNASKEP